MSACGRQTAPPRFEVVLVTFRACVFLLEAFVCGSEGFCAALSAFFGGRGAEVCQHRTTDFVSAASASRILFSLAVSPV